MTDRHVVLHVSPHPDDEAIAVGMTLAALARTRLAGRQPVGQCGSGRAMSPDASPRPRRRPGEPATCSRSTLTSRRALEPIGRRWSSHRSHMTDTPRTRRSDARSATLLEHLAVPPSWWMWGLWADLAVPTMYAPFGEQADWSLALDVLEAYAGELARNDYRRVRAWPCRERTPCLEASGSSVSGPPPRATIRSLSCSPRRSGATGTGTPDPVASSIWPSRWATGRCSTESLEELDQRSPEVRSDQARSMPSARQPSTTASSPSALTSTSGHHRAHCP